MVKLSTRGKLLGGALPYINPFFGNPSEPISTTGKTGFVYACIVLVA